MTTLGRVISLVNSKAPGLLSNVDRSTAVRSVNQRTSLTALSHPETALNVTTPTASRTYCEIQSLGKMTGTPATIFTTIVFILLLALSCSLTVSAATGNPPVRNFSIGVFLPRTGSQQAGPEAEAAVNWTVQKLNEQFRDNFHFQYTIRDTQCDKDVALTTFVDMLCEQTQGKSDIQAVIGPACDDVCQVVGGLAGYRGMPVISNGCSSPTLSDRDLYPTFMRTSSTFTEMEHFLEKILRAYNWQRITVVHGNGTVWLDNSDEFAGMLKHSGFTVRQMSIRHPETLEEDLRYEADHTRVFLLCAYDEDVLRFMDMSQQLGLRDGRYAFLTINLANSIKVHSNWTYHPVLNGLLDVTLDVSPHSTAYQNFLTEVFSSTDTLQHPSTASCGSNYELGMLSALLSDAITLYGAAVNATVSNNSDPSDGASLARHLYGVSVEGVTGMVSIDSKGERTAQFMLHNIQNGCYVPIAIYTHPSSMTVLNRSVLWPGGSRQTPTSSPQCGWSGELCEDSGSQTITIVASTSVSLLVIVASVIFFMNKYIKKRENAIKLQSDDWKICFRDLKKPRYNSGHSADSGTFSSEEDEQFGSTVSIESIDSLRSTVQETAGLYYYHGQVVMVKHINRPYGVIHTASLSKELNQIRQLDSRNINPFLGACTDPDYVCVVSVYCRKGSLYDVLHNSDLAFDCRFVATLSTDISKGLQYLHNSEVGFHGRLMSRNVFVDSTFTCKIGDIHMPHLREGEILDKTTECYRTRNLWSAPEVVTGKIYRQETDEGKKLVWQRADMWSFGVILHEIINRKKPFFSLYDTNIEKALQILRKGGRPDEGSTERLLEIRHRQGHQSSSDQYMFKVFDMLGLCWQRFAELRITSAEVAKRLREYGKEHQLLSSNFFENLIHMMTKSEEELNRQVLQRTKELEDEKKSFRELLNQMLPPTVADQLLRGDERVADCFECVTVFFSDIVQFTQLSASCTAMQVMDIVNALYIYFDGVIESYNVYKVETIGDAYMVASGLPQRNGNQHAGAIAEMALELVSGVGTMTVPHKPNYRLQIRVGIHSGSVVAGVVGKKMPRYCLFGDTVNTASRMESHGQPLKIQISQQTKDLLDNTGGFHIQKRSDRVVIKGKGEMTTYWLTGKDRTVPSPSSQPTTPSPVEPCPSSQPTEPSPSSQPTEPSPSSQPTEPSPSSQPTAPSPVESCPSSQPTEPSPSAQPNPSSQPTEPSPSAQPNPSSQPTEPSPSSQSTEPSPSSQPTEPSPSSQPTEPSPSSQPTEPSPEQSTAPFPAMETARRLDNCRPHSAYGLSPIEEEPCSSRSVTGPRHSNRTREGLCNTDTETPDSSYSGRDSHRHSSVQQSTEGCSEPGHDASTAQDSTRPGQAHTDLSRQSLKPLHTMTTAHSWDRSHTQDNTANSGHRIPNGSTPTELV